MIRAIPKNPPPEPVQAPRPAPVLDEAVLVLNQNYEPLNVCSVRRALSLVFCGKASSVELGDGQDHRDPRFVEEHRCVCAGSE